MIYGYIAFVTVWFICSIWYFGYQIGKVKRKNHWFDIIWAIPVYVSVLVMIVVERFIVLFSREEYK